MTTRISKAALTLSIVAAAMMARAQPAAINAPVSTNGIGPRIQFDSQTYNFGRVLSGTLVNHDFVFTNTGDATLEITGVMPGCGCTTIGQWTHKVEPGKTGVIPIQFRTANYNGPVVKTPSITCNDKRHTTVRFQLHGTVFRETEITPPFVMFNIAPDGNEETNATVHIVNNGQKPMMLSGAVSSQRAIHAELITNVLGKSYDVIIKTVPPLAPGNTQAMISIQNKATNSQPMNLFAMAMVQPVINVTPLQITVPAGPLKTNESFSVFIRNQGSHPLALSEPSVNAQGVEAAVSESQPGRVFIAKVTFPAGFKAPAGQRLKLSIKTNNARMPMVEVPIRQLSSLAPSAPQARITQ